MADPCSASDLNLVTVLSHRPVDCLYHTDIFQAFFARHKYFRVVDDCKCIVVHLLRLLVRHHGVERAGLQRPVAFGTLKSDGCT